MPSATYSIVPGRTPYESGVAPIEIAALPPPSVLPREDDIAHWRVDLMLARLSRLTHYELLQVDRTADWHTVNHRYHALVLEVDGWRVSGSPALARKIEILLDALAEAYEELSTSARRGAYDARLRDLGR